MPDQNSKQWRETLSLPKTDFPMKAGLPKLEERLLKHWEDKKTYHQQCELAKDREKFILHDGPPYANGDIHLGTALNKIIKDIVNRSQYMLGKNALYIPGWDCHGLPIEWKVEEDLRAQGTQPSEIGRAGLRKKCREEAQHWIGQQRSQFKRLGVWGEWDEPYLTMMPQSEAIIASEFMKFAMSGALYRGLKPIMWSVAETTSLAEAEVEYHEIVSNTIWVKFPVVSAGTNNPEPLQGAHILIWTTTPWTIPGNRAIAFSQTMSYGLYQISTDQKIIIADELAQNVQKAGEIESWQRLTDIDPSDIICAHPLKQTGYDFDVPVLAADFVTAETGTGFVHIAPSHGRDDYELCTAHNIETPDMLDADGRYTSRAPGFLGVPVMLKDGTQGSADQKISEALHEQKALFARGKLRHSYPHSWRSKTKVIFRATPQWFISMDKHDLRKKALQAIDQVKWHPPSARNRLRAMVETRPDWVISRQRAWGVPLTIFANQDGEILRDEKVNQRIVEIIAKEGSDAWFDRPAEDFLGAAETHDAQIWQKVEDIVDVWFESGATHAFVLENNPELLWPASLYLEGSDQHRGWFQSSLLEACGTRGRAPYERVLTHGFIVDPDGRKMSKSGGNAVSPISFAQGSGSDILRLWVARSDYENDLSWGDEIIMTTKDAYRKLRNALRFTLGNLHEFSEDEALPFDQMPSLEKFILHTLAELDGNISQAYQNFDFKNVCQDVLNFAVGDLSSFYFDIRKDALYCDAGSSIKRRACRTVLDQIFLFLTKWLSPILCFTAEEAWIARFGGNSSVHLQTFPAPDKNWRNRELAQKWGKIRTARKVIVAALEIERKEKRIGSSLEAAPEVFINSQEISQAIRDVDLAEIAITSQIDITTSPIPPAAFRLHDVPDIAVIPKQAQGQRCARSWKILPDVGSVSAYPSLSPRDAHAVAEYEQKKS